MGSPTGVPSTGRRFRAASATHTRKIPSITASRKVGEKPSLTGSTPKGRRQITPARAKNPHRMSRTTRMAPMAATMSPHAITGGKKAM